MASGYISQPFFILCFTVQFRYADTHALLMGHAARIRTIMPSSWQLKNSRPNNYDS